MTNIENAPLNLNTNSKNIKVYDSGEDEKETRYLIRLYDHLFCMGDNPQTFDNYCGRIMDYPDDLFENCNLLQKIPVKLHTNIKEWLHKVFFNNL